MMSQSALATYLELSDEELQEMGLSQDDLFTTEDASGGDRTFYFNVPDTTPQHVLGKKGWSLGERIEIPGSALQAH